ncbi:MAG: ABC transporter permease [Kordiimonadaceae bacterium]|nr:ABC transporter permease [Kordiimonadaceae bacterium]MBO6567880.1 ABC transporter permease [Kordiimonadaceae bacterium]MBO6964390.1 ABC transporter permease [Kordiimonadaceae bacterium]
MATAVIDSEFVMFENVEGTNHMVLTGDWTIENANAINATMRKLFPGGKKPAALPMLDCRGIDKLDTTGAVLVRRFADQVGEHCEATLIGVPDQHKALLEVIHTCPLPTPTMPDMPPWYVVPLLGTGQATWLALRSLARLLSFLGRVLVRGAGATHFRFAPIVHQMDVVGLRSMGIVGLISFLIGAVMVNQGAIQLAKFGADIFVIDMLGITHLRELGILLTAIIIAGRSGSAFTAQIGSMKLNEEVDAMKTLGMDPIDVLVLPRLVALLICLPLLAFYSDIVGIAGGMLMAWAQLGISPGNFIVYFREVVVIDHFWVGIIKAPFFAAIIATSGCYQGLRVEGSADSLGARTTQSVVQSIFLVIAFDAMFAVFFSAIGL